MLDRIAGRIALVLLSILLAIAPTSGLAQAKSASVVDPWLSFTALEAAAEAGDAVAQYRIGALYLRTGNILAPSVDERMTVAHDWLSRSAKQGYGPGQVALAALLLDPRWTGGDPARGEQMLIDLVSQGSLSAMTELGLADQLRWTSMRREKSGIDLVRHAAEAGDPTAALQLAYAYATGNNLAQDDALALQWYRTSAEGGDPAGQYAYAMLFGTGQFGTPIDPEEQMSWLFLAASGGNPAAQREFARILNDPADPRYDPDLAHGWLQIAAENGDARAEQILFQMGLPGRGGRMPLIPAPGETRQMSVENVVITTGLVFLGLILLAPDSGGGGVDASNYPAPSIPCPLGTIDVGNGVCADLPDW